MSELTSRVKSLDESLWRRLELFRGFVVANKGLVAYLVAVAVAESEPRHEDNFQ